MAILWPYSIVVVVVVVFGGGGFWRIIFGTCGHAHVLVTGADL